MLCHSPHTNQSHSVPARSTSRFWKRAVVRGQRAEVRGQRAEWYCHHGLKDTPPSLPSLPLSCKAANLGQHVWRRAAAQERRRRRRRRRRPVMNETRVFPGALIIPIILSGLRCVSPLSPRSLSPPFLRVPVSKSRQLTEVFLRNPRLQQSLGKSWVKLRRQRGGSGSGDKWIPLTS